MSRKIDKDSLKVGQCIKFSPSVDIVELSEDKQKIYNEDLIFRVMTREDHINSCSYTLRDTNGKIYDYCPRRHFLGDIDLTGENYETLELSDDEEFSDDEKLSDDELPFSDELFSIDEAKAGSEKNSRKFQGYFCTKHSTFFINALDVSAFSRIPEADICLRV